MAVEKMEEIKVIDSAHLERVHDNTAIKVEGLCKYYGNFKVLKGVDLDIERGEFYALMGQNGSGKTTLTSILTCTVLHDGGSVKIHGCDLAEEAGKVKEMIGYVPQANFSCPNLTGKENLVFFARLFGLSRRDAEEVAVELLGKMGLSEDADKRVSKYSGGMRKRLEVATALFPGIELLFLDEPTTGLDPSARKHFLGLLKDVNEEGVTVFLVTHIGEDAEIASRVGFIDEGVIVLEDEPERLKMMSGLRNVLEIDTPFQSQGVADVLKPFSVDMRILETERGYKIYCENPEEVTPSIVRSLDKIGCKANRIETTLPSIEDVFFKITKKSLRS